MAAATQRTSRIELGTAVIPLGLENPVRLAEDLATVDILSGGRVNPGGVSVGTPMLYDHYKTALYPESHDVQDFSKERVLRLLRSLRGGTGQRFRGCHRDRTIRAPGATALPPGLAGRVWYGGGRESAIWPANRGINYMTSSVVSTENISEGTESRDFATIQAEHIDAYRAHHPEPGKSRVSQGLVVIPTDSASDDQIRRYREYAASRFERTKSPQGARGMLFSPRLRRTSDELADQLFAHAGFTRADEVTFALPFTFAPADYNQIITDMAQELGPRLGWQPSTTHQGRAS